MSKLQKQHSMNAQKTATNNQWAGTGKAGKSSQYKDKTATDNQWVSTNKMMDSGDFT